MHMLKQNKGASIETETEKDILTPGDKSGTGCVGSLFPNKEVFQTQGPFLYSQAGVKRIHMRLPFSTWSFVRYCQNAFQQFCINLYPHQEYMSALYATSLTKIYVINLQKIFQFDRQKIYILSSFTFPWLIVKLHSVSCLLAIYRTPSVNCPLINFVQFSIKLVIFCLYICKRLYAL